MIASHPSIGIPVRSAFVEPRTASHRDATSCAESSIGCGSDRTARLNTGMVSAL